MWIGLIWLRIGPSSKVLWTPLGPHKGRGISGPAEQLSACQVSEEEVVVANFFGRSD
jgi:hypothetical protein